MQIVTQVSVAIPNVPSSLAVLGDRLRAADVNINAISCSEGNPSSIIHLIVSDSDTAKLVLHELGPVSQKSVLALLMENKTGVIAKIGRACAAANVNIRNIYATTYGKESMVYIDTDDAEKALSSLKQWTNGSFS